MSNVTYRVKMNVGVEMMTYGGMVGEITAMIAALGIALRNVEEHGVYQCLKLVRVNEINALLPLEGTFLLTSSFPLYILLSGTDQAGTFMSLKCVVYYANYRS